MSASATKENEIVLAAIEDHDEKPSMIQVLSDNTYQEAFVFALAVERKPTKRAYDSDKLLVAIFAGADSAIQSIKASIDIGSQGIRFGYGEKGLSNYDFHKLLNVGAEKGKYTKINMSLPGVPNAVGVVHEEVSTNSKYILSDSENPAEVIADLMGTAFNLHLLDEWVDVVFDELMGLGYVKEHDIYVDRKALPLLRMYSIDMEEEQADAFISDLIVSGKIKFNVEGTGAALQQIDGVGPYMVEFGQEMAERIAESIDPVHDPASQPSLPILETMARPLFPVQAHSATAIAKQLAFEKVKSIILQGEMSTGKSTMMVAACHAYAKLKNLAGYHVGLICPPSLTVKWPKEIKVVIPNAEVHVINKTEEFIAYHSNWVRAGRPKPTKPTFFIFSFTTLRNDSAIRPAVEYTKIRTDQQIENKQEPYREGFYCHDCGKPHMVIESTTMKIKNDREVEEHRTHVMRKNEFGTSRRIGKSTSNPPNSFCYHCGSSLWTKKVERRYSNFAEYVRKYEEPLTNAIHSKNHAKVMDLKSNQPDFPTSTSMPRRVAAAEYIRRKCKGFFNLAVCDEVHELKGGTTAQGHALAAIAGASDKVIAGTGTLFGGKSSDVYYLLWRLFPSEMKAEGFEFREVTRFIEQFGNMEETIWEPKEESSTSYTNKASRGGGRTSRKKEIPGYTPRIYPTFFMKNVVNVRLTDVWPNPVELVDTPTIFVDMTSEQKEIYDSMINKFEDEIDSREDGFKLYTQMLDYGIGYPDNPSQFPDALFKNDKGGKDLIWAAEHLDPNQTFPKEKKLQEIIQNEMSEARPSIVYVRDTGSSVADRDIRPRLKAKLEEIGAKVCILDTTTTATNRRSEWLEKKIVEEGYDVCIVSQELVKVGLDLLCTPTLIYYQFSWSLYTLQQSSRRAWRIGQTEECRLFYLAYANSYQQHMATLVAKKAAASKAVNGESAGDDGLSAMLGDEGDLQSMLLKSIKEGSMHLDGLAEDWIADASERSKELLANIGKPKLVERRLKQIEAAKEEKENNELALDEHGESQVKELDDSFEDLEVEEAAELIDFCTASEEVAKITAHIVTVAELQQEKTNVKKNGKPRKAKSKVSEDQLAFDLFAV